MTTQEIYTTLKRVNPAINDTVIFTTSSQTTTDLYNNIKEILHAYNITGINVLIYQDI